MEKLAQELVEIAAKTANKPAFEDRCLKALSILSTLRVSNQFILFTGAGKLMHSLKSNPRRKPVIREYADRVFTRWMRRVYSRAPEKPTPDINEPTINLKPQSKAKVLQSPTPALAINKSACNLKPESNTKALQNPKRKAAALNKADSILKRRKLRKIGAEPHHINKDKVLKDSEELRNNIQVHVFEGLSMVLKESSNEEFDYCDPVGVSLQVESELFQVWGAAIKNYRSFLYNLKDPKNPDFRRKILTGKLKPEKIATLRPEDMASDQRRIQNHFIRETALNKCIVADK